MSWLISAALMQAFENSRCSQAQAVESSAATSSAGALSAPSSSSPTPHAFLSPDRTTDFSRPSRFGMTFAPLTDDLGAAVLTWCLEAFLARTSASPDQVQASTAPGPASGHTWRGSLARFDPGTSTWRTAQPSLLEDLGESSVIWPRSGMTAGGQCWELPTLAPRTSGIGSGLWLPTPCTVDSGSYFNRSASAGAKLRPTLGAMAKFSLWPTPTVKGNYNKAGLSAKSGDGLATAVKQWPTPMASDWRSGLTTEATAAKNSRPLREVVRWRTPNTVDAKGGTRKPGTGSQVQLCHQTGGGLNPDWVEALMGWPPGWSDLGPMGGKTASPASPKPRRRASTGSPPSATDKSPCATPQPGGC